MHQANSSPSTFRPNERRRSPRYRARSIIYVHIGPDNGGVLLNLGLDGLALQAGCKLTAQKHALLNLRLRGSGLNVGLAGELAWLGVTEKEAGISFNGLPFGVRQDIADWLAREAQLYEKIHGTKPDLQVQPLQGQAAKPVAEPAPDEPAPDTLVPDTLVIGPPQPVSPPHAHPLAENVTLAANATSQSAEDVTPTPTTATHEQELGNALEPETAYEVEAPQRLDHSLPAVSSGRSVSPALLGEWKQGSRQRTYLIAGVGIACLAMIVTLTAMNHRGFSARSLWAGILRQYTHVASLWTRVNPPQTASAQPSTQSAGTDSQPAPRPPKTLLENVADAVGGRRLIQSRTLGDDQGRVKVWTSKNSGFYYCTDSPYYKKVRPGTFMAQRDALQNGYQPKLGEFCN